MKLNSKIYLSIMCMLLCYFSYSPSMIKTQDIKFLLSDPKLQCKVRFDRIDARTNLFTIGGECKGGSFSKVNINDCIASLRGNFTYGSGYMKTCKNCKISGNRLDTFILTCACKKSLSDTNFSVVAKDNPFKFFVWNYTKRKLECRTQ
jgi:hypothetical protein